MNKYKVCVYAICKNEAKFLKRWYDSVKEADKIFLLDTGSTDESMDIVKDLDIVCKREIIHPFRFDTARNLSLDMVDDDADICVCCDVDEVFESGWREELEKFWTDEVTRASYPYNWSFNKYNRPEVSFYINKIHKRHGYTWTHPVHEVLTSLAAENQIIIPTITVNHYPDNNKSRSNYLPLLELSVKEDPEDDRNMHYLGREYMFYGKYNEAIDTLERHLSLKKATWKTERCASMRFISRCYLALGRKEEALLWLKKAVKEEPNMREAYVELGKFYTMNKRYKLGKKYLLKALEIRNKSITYINEVFSWDETIPNLLSVCYYYLKDYKKSLEYINKALEMNPDSELLQTNKKFILEKNE